MTSKSWLGFQGIVDTHAHVWSASDPRMQWLYGSETWEPIRRDFPIWELEDTLGACGVDYVVLVQAATDVDETRALLPHAERSSVVGVVGWVPLSDVTRTRAALAGLTRSRHLVGVRHLVGWEPEGSLFLSGDPLPSLRTLMDSNLLLEFMPSSIEDITALVRTIRHLPDLVVVMDHLAKPLDAPSRTAWHSAMKAFADAGRTYAKISGWTTPPRAGLEGNELRGFVDAALEMFGAERLMFAGNWPVTLVAGSYGWMLEETRVALRGCSPGEMRMIMGDTARNVYMRPSEG